MINGSGGGVQRAGWWPSSWGGSPDPPTFCATWRVVRRARGWAGQETRPTKKATALPHQLPDRLPFLDQRHRPLLRVAEDHLLRLDTQVVIHRRANVLRADRPIGDVGAARVALAHRLSHLHAAAAHQHAEGVAPVVAA